MYHVMCNRKSRSTHLEAISTMLLLQIWRYKAAIGAINNDYNHDSKFNYLDQAHITSHVIGIVVKFYMRPRKLLRVL